SDHRQLKKASVKTGVFFIVIFSKSRDSKPLAHGRAERAREKAAEAAFRAEAFSEAERRKKSPASPIPPTS
ncbi:MAG: hypothetical protein WA194_02805, partial [Patescibacteria group bacterium]